MTLKRDKARKLRKRDLAEAQRQAEKALLLRAAVRLARDERRAREAASIYAEFGGE